MLVDKFFDAGGLVMIHDVAKHTHSRYNTDDVVILAILLHVLH